MPAQLDDLVAPHPRPDNPSTLPPSIVPTQLPLRTSTRATLLPFPNPESVPAQITSLLHSTFVAEIAAGKTYPMLTAPSLPDFASYWFGAFGAVAVRGTVDEATAMLADPSTDWSERVLGTFYVKPNYPGRSAHVCNAGFLVCEGARGMGVGRAMGEAYVGWAGELGYSYSVFNLVYESNVASVRIWDGLGFERIGRVPGCGRLNGSEELVDSIVFGKKLRPARGMKEEAPVTGSEATVDGV